MSATPTTELRLPLYGAQAPPDIAPTEDRYVGYYENLHGEQLIYVHERDQQPVIYHSDTAWKPHPAVEPDLGPLGGWVVGDLIVDGAEALWVLSMLAGSRATDGDPADHLVARMLAKAMDTRHALADLRDPALARWREIHQDQATSEEAKYAEGIILVRAQPLAAPRLWRAQGCARAHRTRGPAGRPGSEVVMPLRDPAAWVLEPGETYTGAYGSAYGIGSAELAQVLVEAVHYVQDSLGEARRPRLPPAYAERYDDQFLAKVDDALTIIDWEVGPALVPPHDDDGRGAARGHHRGGRGHRPGEGAGTPATCRSCWRLPCRTPTTSSCTRTTTTGRRLTLTSSTGSP